MLTFLHWPFSLLASLLRLGAGGTRVRTAQPAETLILYEFEACPFCRIAREAVSQAGLDVIVRPCPKGGERFRPSVKALGGKLQYPYLIDRNVDLALYESGDIARHIRTQYGGSRPLIHWLGPLDIISSQYAVLARAIAGRRASNSQPQTLPLEFHGAERSPGGRLVKEQLCRLELEYVWRPAGTKAGRSPRLIDPATGANIKGVRAISHYLKTTYATVS